MRSGRLLLFSLLLLQACSDHSNTGGYRILRYNEPAGITGLDPAVNAARVENIWILNQVFNTLVACDSANNLVPVLAKNWTCSEDGKTLLMHLRTDVFFHESPCFGKKRTRKMRAADVIFSLKRLLNSQVASSGTWVLEGLSLETNQGMENPDDSTVLFHLNEPPERFLRKISTPYAGITCEEAISYYGGSFRKNPVGTGAFYLKQWTEGQKLVLRKNTRYFVRDQRGRSLPYLDAIAVSFLKDRQSAFLEFLKGNFDFISGIDGSYKDELVTGGGTLNARYATTVRMYKTPYLKCDYLGFCLDSTASKPLPRAYRDARIRRAISLSINREKLIRYLRRSIGIAAESGIVPSSLAGAEGKKRFEYDPAQAARLLAEAGYPKGKGLPPLPLVISSAYQDIAEFIQQECKNAGIPVQLEVVLPAVQSEWVAGGNAPFFRKSWVADYPDAQNFLFLFLKEQKSPAGPNYTRYSSEQFELLYRSYLNETNDSLKTVYLGNMLNVLQDDMPVIPLYYDEVVYFVSTKVNGLRPGSLNYPRFETVQKTPDS